MVRPGLYTPRRRLIMQVVMWVVFAMTMSLAGLVVYSQKRAQHVELGNAVERSGVSIRVPASWRTREVGGRILARAQEYPGKRGGRVLTVYRDTLPAPMAPLEYLASKFNVEFLLDNSPAEVHSVMSMRFGEYPGVVVNQFQPRAARDDEPKRKQVYAAAMLPSGHAIAMQLDGTGEVDMTDWSLMIDVATAMKFRDQPALGDASQTLVLGRGIEVSPPSAFRFIENNDPNRTSRRLWHVASSEENLDQWASIELIPCLFPSTGAIEKAGSTPQRELQTMLLAHDLRWRNAQVKARGADQYQIDPAADRNNDMYPVRAYFQADANGHALLALITAGAEDLDSYWNQIQSKTRFVAASELEDLNRAGAAEIARLREIPLDKLLNNREEQWWLWGNQRDAARLGWSRLSWKPKELGAELERRWRPPGQELVTMTQKWNASPDFNVFDCDAWRSDAGERSANITQGIKLRGDGLSFKAPLASWQCTAPANYVPGALLPHVLNKLSPAPMLLRTESFFGCEAIAPPGLLTVIVRPLETKSTTRSTRSITVEINGTGEISRWDFDADGTLESVRLSDGVQSFSSNESEIKRMFSDDQEMVR